MAYADLIQTQKESLDAWMLLMRSTCGEIARVNNHNEVVKTEYDGTTAGILALLDDADVIPNTSGLQGAEPLTKAQVVAAVGFIEGILAFNTPTHREYLAKAAGEINLIG